MGHHYNFRIPPEEPSRETIDQHRDFDAVLAQFQAAPPTLPANQRLFRRRLFWIATSAAAAAALAGWFFWQTNTLTLPSPEQAQLMAQAHFAEQPCLDVPVPALDKPLQRHTIDAQTGGTLIAANGSRLVFPYQAFQDNRGNAIQGEVDIWYREMHDAVDFFLTGVPMTYDSAGTRYQLESIGMIEIRGTQNGQSIQLAPGKKIQVELLSTLDAPSNSLLPAYNVYWLDTVSRNWSFQGVDQLSWYTEAPTDDASSGNRSLSQGVSDQLTSLDAEEANILTRLQANFPPPIEPKAPIQANAGLPSLDIDPAWNSLEMDAETRTIFQEIAGKLVVITPRSNEFDERMFAVEWDGLRLRRGADGDIELSLIAGTTQRRLFIQPVLLGKAYEEARKKFETAYTRYQQSLADYSREFAQRKEVLLNDLKTRRAQLQQAYTQAVAQEGTGSGKTTRQVRSSFSIDAFGIWNCDRPLPPLPQQVQAARFVDQYGIEYPNQVAFLVDKKQNTIYRLYTSKGAVVPLDQTGEQIIWLITPEQKLAITQESSWFENRKPGKPVVVQVTVKDQAVHSEADVRQLLGLGGS
ncbi:MAG: hypothetical protein H6555_06620 [Lewinellaceae bacterium]|nr:hypothetical protein [Lewinellaceae bacterium]